MDKRICIVLVFLLWCVCVQINAQLITDLPYDIPAYSEGGYNYKFTLGNSLIRHTFFEGEFEVFDKTHLGFQVFSYSDVDKMIFRSYLPVGLSYSLYSTRKLNIEVATMYYWLNYKKPDVCESSLKTMFYSKAKGKDAMQFGIELAIGYRAYVADNLAEKNSVFAGVSIGMGYFDNKDVSPKMRARIKEKNYKYSLGANTPSTWTSYAALYPEDIDKLWVANQIDQTILAEIARKDVDSFARIAAINNLIDQTILGEIARNDEIPSVRLTAVEKLTDQTIIAEIARKDLDSDVREAAVNKLLDQTMLAEIAGNDENSNVRIAALEILTDQNVIAEIAMQDVDLSVRKRAVEILSNQAVLAEIAIDDVDEDICLTALYKVKDKTLWSEIAKRSKNENVRKTAWRGLSIISEIGEDRTNQTWMFIQSFADAPQFCLFRLIEDIYPAYRLLNDPDVEKELGEIVLFSTDWNELSESYTREGVPVGAGGAYAVSGESFWCKIQLKNRPWVLVKNWSTSFSYKTSSLGFQPAIIGPEQLFNLENGDHVFNYLSPSLLAKIALSDKYPGIRRAAVERLTDQTLLAKIAQEDYNESVRQTAQQTSDKLRLNGQ